MSVGDDDSWRSTEPQETVDDRLRAIESQLNEIETKVDKVDRSIFALGLAALFLLFQTTGVIEAIKGWFR